MDFGCQHKLLKMCMILIFSGEILLTKCTYIIEQTSEAGTTLRSIKQAKQTRRTSC